VALGVDHSGIDNDLRLARAHFMNLLIIF